MSRLLSRQELAEIVHSRPSAVNVLGIATAMFDTTLQLRDGDVVWDSLLYDEASQWWARLEQEVSSASTLGLFLGLLYKRIGVGGLLASMWATGATAMRRSVSPIERSRSRSPSPLSSGPWIGRWRPDREAPFAQVTHQGHVDYCVLCPFRGWSSYYYSIPSSPADELFSVVADFAGSWVQGCTLVGATNPRLPLVALLHLCRASLTVLREHSLVRGNMVMC